MVTVFQVLPEVIGAEELLTLVAFSKFVNIGQMSDTIVPIRLWLVGEFLAAITADVYSSDGVCRWRRLVRSLGRNSCRRMEGAFVVACERSA